MRTSGVSEGLDSCEIELTGGSSGARWGSSVYITATEQSDGRVAFVITANGRTIAGFVGEDGDKLNIT